MRLKCRRGLDFSPAVALGAVLALSSGLLADPPPAGAESWPAPLSLETTHSGTHAEPASTQGHGPPASSDGSVETGTDPAKLLRRLEFNPQYTDVPGPGYLITTNVKLDVPLTQTFAVAMDAPVSYAGGFPTPVDDQFGLGDIAIRARNVWSFEKFSLIAGAEGVLKTADDELLGSGKWQLNPTVAYVHHISKEYLLALAWKQRLSIAGDDDRPDINQSELRIIGIYINPKGWWLQADFQPKLNWNDDCAVIHLMEFEAGTMVSRSLGFSIRPGVGFGENREREWSIGFGMRVFF